MRRFFRPALATCVAFLSLGVLGLVLLTPPLRARRARRVKRCATCRRRHSTVRITMALLALVLLAGSAARAGQEFWPTPHCASEHFTSGAAQRASESATGPARPRWWRATREIITAPVSGLAHFFARARGMDLCEIGGLTVGFLPGAAKTRGATVGDIFLTRVERDLSARRVQALRQHESRHVDQWALLTLAAGPAALPFLYSVDEALFPGPRNHFERAAGLRAGGYEIPEAFGPQPRWPSGALLGLALALYLRPRLRRLSRALVADRGAVRGGNVALHDGSGTAASRDPGTSVTDPCPLHTPGWFRQPPGSQALNRLRTHRTDHREHREP